MLFENIYENTCGWKSALKCVKYCLKTENGCLRSQTKHPITALIADKTLLLLLLLLLLKTSIKWNMKEDNSRKLAYK